MAKPAREALDRFIHDPIAEIKACRDKVHPGELRHAKWPTLPADIDTLIHEVERLNRQLDHATAFMFPVDPTVDELRLEFDAIFVEWRGHDGWCVIHRQRWVMGRDGEWEYEPIPSSRTPEFIARTRFPRDEAILLALGEVARRRAEAGIATSDGAP